MNLIFGQGFGQVRNGMNYLIDCAESGQQELTEWGRKPGYGGYAWAWRLLNPGLDCGVNTIGTADNARSFRIYLLIGASRPCAERVLREHEAGGHEDLLV
jgi:hypothetical protein